MSDKTKGLIAVIISAIFFGLTPLFMKTAYTGGATNFTCAFYRFLMPLLPQWIYLRARKFPIKISRKELGQISIMSIFGYGGTAVLLFLSYNYLPSGMCTTLHFVYPIFVIIGCIFFFKERANFLKLFCVFLCSIGIFLFYNGEGGSNLLGIFIAFSSGITYAFYIIYLDKSGLQKMNTIKLVFYLNAVAAAFVFVTCLLIGDHAFIMTQKGFIVMAFAAISLTFVAVNCFQIGVKYVGPQSAAILSTFEPITSVVIGILVFHEVFSLRTIMGCVAILTAVVIVAKMEDRR